MPLEIKRISIQLPLRLGTVNCYLIKTGVGYFLIDSGSSNRRTLLEKELQSVGCRPGNLKQILLTHGDFDHTGNAAYLRRKFGVKIAMHNQDSGMVENGNIFWNRKKRSMFITRAAAILFRFSKSDRFQPDLSLEDGCHLSRYGFDAEVLHLPGHSAGSLGFLTASGDLFCGDLLVNGAKPTLNSIIDDEVAAKTSIDKLEKYHINTVYPGHGRPFSMEEFITNKL